MSKLLVEIGWVELRVGNQDCRKPNSVKIIKKFLIKHMISLKQLNLQLVKQCKQWFYKNIITNLPNDSE